MVAWAAPACAQQLAQADLNRLSIEQLANVEITTVSKQAQPLSEAAAPVYVIGRDDIAHSGANSLPEMLRLAPNLEVMQTSPYAWQITSRGLNGNSQAQNFPNKLLVLIDGRSVYSPLYSGVYWDMQDVLPEDIERIEVVSGPGGTLWGANAVNGVINIVTRGAGQTQGGFASLGAGNLSASAALQYGGSLDDDLSYRVYAKTFYDRAFDKHSGGDAHDGWGKPQAGFRLDWTPGTDSLTLSGDLFRGVEGQAATTNQTISGGNLTAHWSHPLENGAMLQVQAYYDSASRNSPGNGGFTLHTYDLEVQHEFAVAEWNSLVWGGGDRVAQYRIIPRVAAESSLLWEPAARSLNIANLFLEDHVRLGNRVEFTAGLKLEDDPYSGITPMPSARISWNVDANTLIWAATSHAARSPTPFDVDVVEQLGALRYLTGNTQFEPEMVTAYELGYRGQLSRDFSVSLSLFDDVYDDLRSIETTPATFIPLYWGNKLKGSVYGLEAWANWQIADWWRLAAGVNQSHEDFRFDPGASKLLGTAQLGDDPHHQAWLRSTFTLTDDVTIDTDLRDVGALPDPKVPEYVELNARLGWRISPLVEISLSGSNLLHARHLEFVTGGEDLIPRSFFLETRWRF